jgi:hypothetical protein
VKLDKNILKELQEIAPSLAKLDKVNFYELEEGYFEDSHLKIVEAIGKSLVHVEAMPSVLSSIPKKNLYAAPAVSYFESFSDALMDKVNAEEVLEELSYALPILEHAEKKELYKVPASYFASFPKSIMKLVSKEALESPVEHWANVWSAFTETVLILISRPRYSFAMASVAGMIVCIGLVINTKTILSDEDKIFAQMQQIPDADIHHYIAKHRDEFDERILLHNINNIDFTHYFDKPEQVTPHIESHTKGPINDEINAEDILD